MPNILPAFKLDAENINVTVKRSENIKVTNITIPSINTEVSHSLTTEIKTLIIRCREVAELKISFEVGESGTKFFTVPKANSLKLDDLNLTGKTLYLQSPSLATVEILEQF